MGFIHCPLCCQQEFESIVALREHLLYYTYRPVMCFLCKVPFHGINSMIQHLEVHVNRTTVVQCNSDVNVTSNKLSPVDQNSETFVKPNEASTVENHLPTTKHIVAIAHSPGATAQSTEQNLQGASKSDNTCRTENEQLDSRNCAQMRRELVIRAYTCAKCGAKVVGKDAYFTHLQNSCVGVDTQTQHNAHKSDLSEDAFSDASFNDSDESTDEHDLSLIDSFGSQSGSPNANPNAKTKDCHPYIHKKFDHDLERKALLSKGKVSCYMNTFQSFLIDRLNQTTETDPNAVTKCVVEQSQHSRQTSSKPPTKAINYKCKHCAKTYSKSFLVVRHQNECHTVYKLPCKICGFKCKSHRSLLNHMGLHSKAAFKCKVCRYSCRTASGLRTHAHEAHSQAKSLKHVCSTCNKTFQKRYGLQRHIQRTHQPLNLVCDKCNKKFSSKEDFNSHIQSHKALAFACPICNGKFANKWCLHRHQQTAHQHTTAGLFSCHLCEKGFNRKDILHNHLKLHNNLANLSTKRFFTKTLPDPP